MRYVMLCAVTALATLGCVDTSAPAPVWSRYRLSTYDGQPLPVVLTVSQANPATPGGGPTVTCENRLASMRLELDGREGYFSIGTMLTVCDDGSPARVSSSEETGKYVAKGDSVTMTASSPTTSGVGRVHRSYATRSGNALRVYRQEVESPGFGTTTDLRTLLFVGPP